MKCLKSVVLLRVGEEGLGGWVGPKLAIIFIMMVRTSCDLGRFLAPAQKAHWQVYISPARSTSKPEQCNISGTKIAGFSTTWTFAPLIRQYSEHWHPSVHMVLKFPVRAHGGLRL